MSDGGKGSSPRPFSVSDDEYKKRWDMIFGRDLESDEKALEEVEKSKYLGGATGSAAVSKTEG